MSKSKEQTDLDYTIILKIYEDIVKKAGEYAPYLSKEYFYENTIHECRAKGMSVSKTTIWRALRSQPKLEKLKPFMLDGINKG
nr:hypothetical protein [uncultured Draconibacterium sp.]